MKRRALYASVIFAIFAVWLGLLFKLQGHADTKIVNIIKAFPLLLLMTFGSYCLAKLGYDMMTFNDYPQEIDKLKLVSVEKSHY